MESDALSTVKENWRLFLILLFSVVISEAIGHKKITTFFGVIVLFPMLYAMILGFFFNPRIIKFVREENLGIIQSLTMTGIALLAAKMGTTIGERLPLLLELGWILFLQEFGHFTGTIIIALPFAVLMGLGRESIGASFTLAREYAIALIGEKYGINSPEGRGVLAQYFFGTLIGTIYFGLMAGWIDSLGFFNPIALAMASGVGSASMMAASASALIALHPELKQQILAISGASNLITVTLGLYLSTFLSLPLSEKLYKLLKRKNNADE